MYQDLLPRIKNALRSKKESVVAPFSQLDFEIAKLLVEKGYLADAQKKSTNRKNAIEIKLKYKEDHPAISDFKMRSKPSRRLYVGYRDLHPVRQGYGLAVLSTPSGIMTAAEARRRKLGGEYLFEIW